MEMVSFWYDKSDGSPEKLRFVAVKQSDSAYIHGYDLLDNNNYKQFLRSRIKGPIASLGFEQDSVLLSGSVVDIDSLLRELNYTSSQREIAKELADDVKLAQLYHSKTGNDVLVLNNGHFFKYAPRSVDVQFTVDKTNIRMNVREGVFEYFDENGTKLTPLEFSRVLLGIAHGTKF